MEELTPQQIVNELDKYIISQQEAKKAVAIALRNRYRRSKLPPELQEEVVPKNILMIGPTGVGKTEIARRLARLVKAPFIKVEATKFTEVGYVGRDVESMVRDLVEASVRITKQEKISLVQDKARELAQERLVELLAPSPSSEVSALNPLEMIFGGGTKQTRPKDQLPEKRDQTLCLERKSLRDKLKQGKLEQEYVEIEVEDTVSPMLEVFTGTGMEELGINMQDMLGSFFPKKKRKRKVTVAEARKILTQQEAQKLIDMDEVTSQAIQRAEEHGIVFLDEIDKIAGSDTTGGPHNHRENFYPIYLASRTFCEKFEVTETLPKDIEIKPYFSQPLYAVTCPGKQQNPTLLSLVKNIFLFHTWIEVHIEGEITVEVIVNKTHEPAKIIPGKKLNVTCSEQKNILINQVKTAQAGVKQIKPDASTGVTIPFPAFYPVSKNQIPGRTGLHKTFLQKYTPPPSKPE